MACTKAMGVTAGCAEAMVAAAWGRGVLTSEGVNMLAIIATFVACSARGWPLCCHAIAAVTGQATAFARSEEHTSELQSPCNLVCRLLLEKKKNDARCVNISPIAEQTVNRIPKVTLTTTINLPVLNGHCS